MLRNVLGVIVGYVALGMLIFVTFTGAYLAMGADGAFKPGTYDPSVLWTVVAFVMGTIAAIAGGAVCALISRRKGAVIALMVVVMVLGLGEAVYLLAVPPAPPGERTGEVSNLDAMMKAIKPVWVAVANPLLGAVGVWLGGRLVLKNKA